MFFLPFCMPMFSGLSFSLFKALTFAPLLSTICKILGQFPNSITQCRGVSPMCWWIKHILNDDVYFLDLYFIMGLLQINGTYHHYPTYLHLLHLWSTILQVMHYLVLKNNWLTFIWIFYFVHRRHSIGFFLFYAYHF